MGQSFSKNDDIHTFFVIKERLGMGSFATVKRCVRKKDKQNFAVKQIKKKELSEEDMKTVTEEVKIMKSIDHPNCVKLYEVFQSSKKVYMVMELLTGGELFDRIVKKGSYSEKEASDVIGTLLRALKYLHSQNIVHRDLKPENLLYTGPQKDADIKITDFGLAKAKSGTNDLETACGTPGYVAPEVLSGSSYGAAVDVWSLGVILYILLCGFPPFYHDHTRQLYKQIKSGIYAYPSPYWDDISDDAKNVVDRCLTVNPDERATPDELLEHPWIKGDTASDKNLGDQFNYNLKLLSAKSQLRKGVRALIALNRFKRAINAMLAEEEK
jgi:calcium/calmodulin-dependent protein kinase I